MATKKPKQKKRTAGSLQQRGYAPLVVLPTTTEEKTVAGVREAGYCVVLCDDPSKVKVILAGNDVVGGDLLMSALHGVLSVAHHSDESHEMVIELYRRMKEREAGQNDGDQARAAQRATTQKPI